MEGWKKEQLSYFGNFRKGTLLSKEDIVFEGKIPCIHYGELFTKYREVIGIIHSMTNKNYGLFSKYGDILFPASDVTPTGLGKASTIKLSDVLLGGDLHVLRPTIEVDSVFLSYHINFKKNDIIKLVVGSTVKHSKAKDLGTLTINFPESVDEQRKIAAVLSTVDRAIEQTEQLIAKYHHIKQGLIHDLLTYGIDSDGNIRNQRTHKFETKNGILVPSEWEVDTVYNVANIINGGTPNTQLSEYWDGDIPWLSVDDFNNGERYVSKSNKHITKLGLYNSATKLLSSNDIIISARGTVGVIAQIEGEMAFNQSCYGLRTKQVNLLLNDFLYYYLLAVFSSDSVVKSGSTFDTITKNTFQEIKIKLPSIIEQRKIINTVYSQDKLITREEENLTKYKKIKQGLMHDLLTPTKRVKL